MPESCHEALQAHRGNRLNEAATLYRDCLTANPANFEARSNLGAVLAQQGDYGEAIQQYKLALDGAPPAALSALQRNLALAYYKSGQVPRAAAELAEVHTEEPNDRQTLLLLADCYLLMGEPAKTVSLLEGVPETDATVDYLLGTALIRSGNVERGKVAIDRILRQSESAEAHMLLGAGMFEARDYPSAVAELSKAVKIKPDLPLANSYLGQALLATGDADGATAAFGQELASNPNDYDANLRLGEIRLARGGSAEALRLLNRAAAIRPEADAPHRGLLAAYRKANSAADTRREQQWLREHGARETEQQESSEGNLKGKPAPELALQRHDSGAPVTLAQFRGKGPVLLVFASYSCPQFRTQVTKLNSLYERFGSRVPFLLVYIREAHAGAGWQSTANQREGIDIPEAKTMEQKQANAELCLRKLKIRFTAAVDDVDGIAEKAYAAWPSRVFLVDKQGRIAFETHLDEQEFHAVDLEKALIGSVPKTAVR